ncbi:MAG: type II toxin-antitoxin system VapC family toxin [Eubacterium sp.]|nr:type II toxin-antitoxin system VapC family toxin [Eubacterium sp.]
MKLLLDTHIILWAFSDDDHLSEKARTLILDRDNTVYYSLISVWELSIKHMLHPDQFVLDPAEFCNLCRASGYYEMPLEESHIITLESLKQKKKVKQHNDPFDRMLIAQAKSEGMTLLTHDRMSKLYEEKCLLYV